MLRKDNFKGHAVATPSLRDLFRSREGYYLVSADYSAAELKALALLANDTVLINAFAQGLDVHRMNARDLFGYTRLEDVTNEERDTAKIVVFGMNYGGGYETIHGQVAPKYPHITPQMVKLLIQRWYAAHPAIKQWQDMKLQQALDNGYVEDIMTGARFNFYGDIKVPVVYNFPIQSLVAWRVKKAMKDIAARLNWETEFILMQIHDDIVLEGKSWYRLARILKQEMEKPVLINDVDFSFTVEIKIGTNWAHLIKLSEIMKNVHSSSSNRVLAIK